MFYNMIQRAREDLKQRHLQLAHQQEEERRRQACIDEDRRRSEEGKKTSMLQISFDVEYEKAQIKDWWESIAAWIISGETDFTIVKCVLCKKNLLVLCMFVHPENSFAR